MHSRCVPPACCPYVPACTAWGVPAQGVYLPRGGCTWSRGVYLPRDIPGPGGVCTWSRGGVPGHRGVPASGGCTWSQGVPAQVLEKNITFGKLHLQVVTRMHSSRMRTVHCSGHLIGRWYLPRVGVYTSPCGGQNSWHTLVKTLPFRNFVCGR